MNLRLALIRGGMRLSRTKQRWNSAELTRANVERLAAHPPRSTPSRLMTRGVARSESFSGCPVHTLTPPDSVGDRRIVFLHGGGYIREIFPIHWQFAAQLARSIPAIVDVPLYPLAPGATASTTVPLITELVAHVVRTNLGPVSIVGDSAGGGLALAVAQRLRDVHGLGVAHLVLLSPWLDLTLSDGRLAGLDRRDLTIGVAGGREAARMYAGALPVDDPTVSPLFAELGGLAPIDVFAGTEDLVSVDALRLHERCESVGQVCRLRHVDAMPHVFPLLPLVPQARAARAEIVELLSS